MSRSRSPKAFLSALALLGALCAGLLGSHPNGVTRGTPAPELAATHAGQAQARDLAALRAQRDAAPSHREALALQRRIEQRKRQTELQLLHAQARAARAAGDTALGAAIDTQLRGAEKAWDLAVVPLTFEQPQGGLQ